MKKRGNSKKRISKTVISKSVGVNVKKEVKHQTFWAVMGIFFLASFIFLINTIQDNSNLTGRVAVQTISYAVKGTDLFFEVRDVLNVKDITVNLADTVKGGNIKFIENVNPSFDGVVISGFTITKNDIVKINTMLITLKVKEADITTKGLTKSDVQLYVAGNPLITKVIEVKEGYVFYQASTLQLGEFVIGKQTSKVVAESISKKPMVQQPTQVEQPAVLEKPMPVVERISESKVVGEAISTGLEERGFFGKIADFFKNLFN